jgi:hypothetical protein
MTVDCLLDSLSLPVSCISLGRYSCHCIDRLSCFHFTHPCCLCWTQDNPSHTAIENARSIVSSSRRTRWKMRLSWDDKHMRDKNRLLSIWMMNVSSMRCSNDEIWISNVFHIRCYNQCSNSLEHPFDFLLKKYCLSWLSSKPVYVMTTWANRARRIERRKKIDGGNELFCLFSLSLVLQRLLFSIDPFSFFTFEKKTYYSSI